MALKCLTVIEHLNTNPSKVKLVNPLAQILSYTNRLNPLKKQDGEQGSSGSIANKYTLKPSIHTYKKKTFSSFLFLVWKIIKIV